MNIRIDPINGKFLKYLYVLEGIFFVYFINLLYIHTPPITIIASITNPIKKEKITFIIKDIITSNIIKTVIPIIIFPIILNYLWIV